MESSAKTPIILKIFSVLFFVDYILTSIGCLIAILNIVPTPEMGPIFYRIRQVQFLGIPATYIMLVKMALLLVATVGMFRGKRWCINIFASVLLINLTIMIFSSTPLLNIVWSAELYALVLCLLYRKRLT